MPACTWGFSMAQLEACALQFLLLPNVHAELAAWTGRGPDAFLKVIWPDYGSMCIACQQLLQPQALQAYAPPPRSALNWTPARGLSFDRVSRSWFQQHFSPLLPHGLWEVCQQSDCFLVIFMWSVCIPTLLLSRCPCDTGAKH